MGGRGGTAKPVSVDAHTHIFCWGENPDEGYLSRRTRESFMTKFVITCTGIEKERGGTMSQKMRNRFLADLYGSSLDYVVVLAQDAIYRADGTRDDDNTHFYVSNDYVFGLAKESPRIIPCASINPKRRDAIAELERCRGAGSPMVKIHTAIQGVSPDLPEFDPFYRRAAELGVVLLFHTGYEHSCKVVSQKFTDPLRLSRACDHGGTVIAAHCGTCAFFDPEDYYPNFVEAMRRHPNLYGDTAVMASLIRWNSLRRLAKEDVDIRSRIVHGSDYPFPPARLPHLLRTGLSPMEARNPLDKDLLIKRSYGYGDGYENQILGLLGLN